MHRKSYRYLIPQEHEEMFWRVVHGFEPVGDATINLRAYKLNIGCHNIYSGIYDVLLNDEELSLFTLSMPDNVYRLEKSYG